MFQRTATTSKIKQNEYFAVTATSHNFTPWQIHCFSKFYDGVLIIRYLSMFYTRVRVLKLYWLAAWLLILTYIKRILNSNDFLLHSRFKQKEVFDRIIRLNNKKKIC